MNVATAPRKRAQINRRRLLAYGYCGAVRLLRALGKNRAPVRRLLCYPIVPDKAMLADLVNRLAWYLPASGVAGVEVLIPVVADLRATKLDTLTPPPAQHNFIGQAGNIRLIGRDELDFTGADAVMLWDTRPMLAPRVLCRLAKTSIIDPQFYQELESSVYRRLYFNALDGRQKEEFRAISRRNFQEMVGRTSGCAKGYVFGTGPSLEKSGEFDFSDGFRVICNSIVKNKPLLRHIRPHLLTFADPVFHFSPCRYAEEFRSMALETVDEFGCYVIIPDYNMPLMLDHYPALENRIIGITIPGIWDMSLRELFLMTLLSPGRVRWLAKIPGHQEEYHFPTLDGFFVRMTSSVMTTIMVPLASSLCREVYVIGADGRQPGDNYFWQHSPASQLGDLMQTVFDTHPSFFRDASYTDYYEQYCRTFEALIRHGESLGKRYYTLTPSYIPALAARPAPGGKV